MSFKRYSGILMAAAVLMTAGCGGGFEDEAQAQWENKFVDRKLAMEAVEDWPFMIQELPESDDYLYQIRIFQERSTGEFVEHTDYPEFITKLDHFDADGTAWHVIHVEVPSGTDSISMLFVEDGELYTRDPNPDGGEMRKQRLTPVDS